MKEHKCKRDLWKHMRSSRFFANGIFVKNEHYYIGSPSDFTILLYCPFCGKRIEKNKKYLKDEKPEEGIDQ